jgi:general secretion pathway protein D
VKSVLQTSLLVATMVAMAGCASMRPIPPARLILPEQAPLEVDPGAAWAPMPGAEPADAAGADGVDHADGRLVRPGSGEFVNRRAASRAPDPAGKPGEVTFNFEGESLHAVIKAILGEFLQENYVIAPGVQGNVTFSTARPMRADQALSILEMLLRWNNATLVWEDGRYTVLPVGQAIPGNLTPRMGDPKKARGYEIRAVPLQYISAVEMERVLKPYAKPEAVINVDPARNMIVLAGTRAELSNYLETVEIFDVDWLAGMSVGVFSLQQAEAGKVVAELEKIFGEGSNTPLAGMFRFMPMEGINGVMVITPQPKYLATIEEWLERFDLGAGEAGQRLYVYDVKNIKAADLASTLSEIFGGSGGGSSMRSSGTVAPGLHPVEIGASGVPSTRLGEAPRETQQQRRERRAEAMADVDAPPAAVVDAAGGISLGAVEQVRVSAVEESNALLVRATSGQWEAVRRVIERLDQIPLQVVIEAQIVQVTLNDKLEYGVRWYFETAIADNAVRQNASGRSDWSTLASSIVNGTTSWSVVGPDVHALVELIDAVANVTVLSAPTLVVLNNKVATINSGRQIPVQTTNISFPGTGGTGQPFQTTQYLQTGITLTVTPRVNPGGLVFLEIDQEDSTPGPPPSGGGNPPIDQSKIKTEVAVQSGHTVLLGGLIKQTDSDSSSGLPGLHRIPILGGLFGGKKRSTDRQELLVVITPRVIADPLEARRITDEYKTRFRGLQPLLQPHTGENR